MAKTFEMDDPNFPGKPLDVPAEEVKQALKDGLTLSSRMDRSTAKAYGDDVFAKNAAKRAEFEKFGKDTGLEKATMSDEGLTDMALGMGAGTAIKGVVGGVAGRAGQAVRAPPPSGGVIQPPGMTPAQARAAGLAPPPAANSPASGNLAQLARMAKNQVYRDAIRTWLKRIGLVGTGAGGAGGANYFFNRDD